MGRHTYTYLWDEQNRLYHAPHNHAFYAPTDDPIIAWIRGLIDPRTLQSTEPLMENPLPPHINIEPPLPTLVPTTPSLFPEPGYSVQSFQINSLWRQQLSSRVPRAPLPLSGTSSTLTRTPLLYTPVILADGIMHDGIIIPRYAILGPYTEGMLWRGRSLQLSEADTHTVILRKNHGTSLEKPGCTIIEAEFLLDTLPCPRVLLAAHILVDSTFGEEYEPNQYYVGDAAGFQLFDRIDRLPVVPNYGISHTHYQRATFSEPNTESDSMGEDESDEELMD
ncbi:hypothetical protein C8R44DRAFT_885770 [Mycena epipterygia]|nr:hypothetical protein C8R44DRAFT_885770 [Mycena epipterygia]